MVKTYEIHNAVSAVYMFTLGKAQPFKAEFTGGRLDLKRPVTAKFTTPHLGQQLAIENSPLFNKVVFLKKDGTKTQGQSKSIIEAGVKVASTAPVEDETVVEVAEVTTIGEAINYLKGRGAKATQMRTPEAVLAMAERMMVSFPNLKAEEEK